MRSNKTEELAALAHEIDEHLIAVRKILRQPLLTEYARGNLTAPQTAVMQVLVRGDGISLKELSRELGLAHSTTSGIVDRLEKQGLVCRGKDDADRRSNKIAVTSQVREFLKTRVPQLTISPLLQALEMAKPNQRMAIIEGLRMLRHLVEK